MQHTIGLFEAVVLGLVQGLTEFLPVSSSAHLRIVGALVPGWGDSGAAFTAITQLGTETAVLLYFRREIVTIVSTWARSLGNRSLRSDPAARMGWYVIVGSIPIGVLGLAFKNAIESSLRNLWLTATMLVIFGLVLGAADRYAVGRGRRAAVGAPSAPGVPSAPSAPTATTAGTPADSGRGMESLTLRDAALYGLAQALALIPGVSRSGGTIAAGLFLGYRREAAARFAFLLALPAVYLSGLFELRHLGGPDAPVQPVPTAVATVIAFVVGYAVIAWFLRYISRNTFTPFVVYRVVLGLVVMALLATDAINAT